MGSPCRDFGAIAKPVLLGNPGLLDKFDRVNISEYHRVILFFIFFIW